ncbi:MAG TPA: lytic transglycosylase domain-containing protein [Clostridia bacterium]|nr:lytic transglycosylase domain-containing protein [Clostridia bacterium]
MKKISQIVALVGVLALPSAAAEFAHLRNGFSIRHERHEISGATTRLYLGATEAGFVDVATDQVIGYEHDNSVPAEAEPSQLRTKEIHDHVTAASDATGIDADFIHSIIRRESGFNPKAVSPKGAQGLMQLMPATAGMLGVKDSFDPASNIDGGTRYLRELLNLYKGDAVKALAAYNAGPHRVEQYRGVPPYAETRAYVAGIIRDYNKRKSAAKPTTAPAKPAAKPSARPRVRTADSGAGTHPAG